MDHQAHCNNKSCPPECSLLVGTGLSSSYTHHLINSGQSHYMLEKSLFKNIVKWHAKTSGKMILFYIYQIMLLLVCSNPQWLLNSFRVKTKGFTRNNVLSYFSSNIHSKHIFHLLVTASAVPPTLTWNSSLYLVHVLSPSQRGLLWPPFLTSFSSHTPHSALFTALATWHPYLPIVCFTQLDF